MSTTYKLLLSLCCAIPVATPVLTKSKHTPIYVPAAQIQAPPAPDSTDLQQELESLSGCDLYDLAQSVEKKRITEAFEDAQQDLASAIEAEKDRRRIKFEKLDRKLLFFFSAVGAVGATGLILFDPEIKKVCSPWLALAPVSLWVAGWGYPLVPRAFNYLMQAHTQQEE